jgi:hypothetical protein
MGSAEPPAVHTQNAYTSVDTEQTILEFGTYMFGMEK